MSSVRGRLFDVEFDGVPDMAVASCLLGADFGTGGAKAALIDDAGVHLGYAYEEYPIYTDRPGWSEHEAPRYWEAFCRMVRRLDGPSGTEEVRWIAEHIGAERVFKVTANRLEDHPVLVNVLWERDHHPRRYRTIAKVLTIDGFTTFRLTGKATAHFSAAPFFGVCGILAQRFDPDLLEAMGVDPALLPSQCRG